MKSHRSASKRRSGFPKKPGTLVYFGGAVHEVLADGWSTREREDLVSGSSKRLWKPKWTTGTHRYGRASKSKKRPGKPKRTKRWIQEAHIKRGALRRQLRVPEGETIPLKKLKWAAKQPGKLGQRARLALNFRKMKMT